MKLPPVPCHMSKRKSPTIFCWPLLSRRRKVYDQTGSLEDSEELAGEKFNDLYEYYRGLFVKVSYWA